MMRVTRDETGDDEQSERRQVSEMANNVDVECRAAGVGWRKSAESQYDLIFSLDTFTVY